MPVREIILSHLTENTDAEALHDMILCCYEAYDERRRLSKSDAIINIRTLTRKQKRDRNTLYNPHRNISLNQCIGDSKTPVSDWLNLSEWREWD